MDTIHTLNTSLPSSTVEKTRNSSNHDRNAAPAPPLHSNSTRSHISARAASPSVGTNISPTSLHAAFKAAAFSVTQLYKAASAEGDSSRAAGYQDAIDDLLAFLDAENLGLGDGEGWRVRQWATQRLHPSMYGIDMNGVTPDNQIQDVGARNANEGHDSQSSIQHDQTATDDPETSVRHEKDNSASKQLDSTTEKATKDSDMANLNSQSPVSSANTHCQFVFSQSPPISRTRLAHQAKNMAIPLSLGSLGQGAGAKRKPPPIIGDYFDFAALSNTGTNGWWSPNAMPENLGSGKRSRRD